MKPFDFFKKSSIIFGMEKKYKMFVRRITGKQAGLCYTVITAKEYKVGDTIKAMSGNDLVLDIKILNEKE